MMARTKKKTSPGASLIKIADIVRDAAFQPRMKLNIDTVKKYANVYREGGSMPPVIIGNVNGMYVLVDGWHRIAALEYNREEQVEATVSLMSQTDALWQAHAANLTHGLPLKNTEIRDKVFPAYIRSKRHINQWGSYKSYRDMAKDLGKGHRTIHEWMRKQFPKIARKIGGAENLRDDTEASFEPSDRREPAIEKLEQAFMEYQSMADALARGAVIEHMEWLLTRMKEAGNWEIEEVPF